jgi:hypothetical protein
MLGGGGGRTKPAPSYTRVHLTAAVGASGPASALIAAAGTPSWPPDASTF